MMLLVAAVSILLSLKTSSMQRREHISAYPSSLVVGCWDGCFDASSLASIENAGRRRSHSFTSIFDRRNEPRSPLECAIQSILNELDDASSSDFFVEYWWRDPTDNNIQCLEAHRDVDEELCRKVQTPVELGSAQKIGMQRCPQFGHVLYVAVDNALSPTLVFEENHVTDKCQRNGGPPRNLKSLWSVPAYTNRLLRFRGDCLHAVSYPPLKWLDVANSSNSRGLKSLDTTTGSQKRAVLLFNTWQEPPLYPAVGEPLVGGEAQLMHADGQSKCQPMSQWKETHIVPPDESDDQTGLVTLDVPLLGGFSRRGCVESSLKYKVNVDNAVTALTSKSTAQGIKLHSPNFGDVHE